MFKRVVMIGLLVISLLAILRTEAKAYNFSGYTGVWNTYLGQWKAVGGQKPGTTDTFLVGHFTFQTGALVCGNPGTNQRDVRSGLGGTVPIEAISSQDQFNFDKRGNFTVDQHVLTTVAEFTAFCDPSQTGGAPAQCFQCGTSGTQLCTGLEIFELVYNVSTADCKNGWTPLEYLWGNHTAEGTIQSDCVTNTDGTLTCGTVQDNVTYSCTTNKTFKDYSKGAVLFNCTCTANCDQGIK